MKRLNTYKNFFNGRYLSEGVRITAGIALPALIMGYLNMLPIGIVMSLGALCVSISDSPGPVRHRFNGMLYCNLLISIVVIIICYASPFPILLVAAILIFGFLFSMLTIYGVRISSIGIAALLIMILTLENNLHGIKIWTNALYILAGGTWYMIFSLTLYTIRPYRIIQQILGDLIIEISDYLKLRGDFYVSKPDYEKTYHALLQQQVKIQAQQSLLSDLLFKTRTIVKESTHKSRVLLKIYVDVTDLFESIMTSFQDYKILHEHFDETKILEKVGTHILSLTEEMKDIGLAVKSGIKSVASDKNLADAKEITALFESLRQHYMNKENLDNFISLGRIVNNVQYLTEKINGLHYYTSYDKKIKKAGKDAIEQSDYTESQDIRPAIFFNNLNLQSNVFRHSIRVTVALFAGYIVSLIFNIGHSYWILLTIVVILKPAYSLTKKRNTDRLIGTLLGIFLGATLIYFIKDKTVLLVIMLVFMIVSYSFIRTNYFITVLAMTPYLVIFFHFLYPSVLRILLTDRIIDTAIGSAIAFVASIFFIPAWEHTAIRSFMVKMINADMEYYSLISNAFVSNDAIEMKEFKNVRRNLLTALANVSDAFNRMLSEPKRFQKSAENVHRFVVLNHLLTAHFATLSYYLNIKANSFRSVDLIPVIEHTQYSFISAAHSLELKEGEPIKADRLSINKLNSHAIDLLENRRKEISHPYSEGLFNLTDIQENTEIEKHTSFLQQFINDLKELDKALMLLYLEEKSHKEMSAIMGISETNVATKIGRIKIILKQKFSQITT